MTARVMQGSFMPRADSAIDQQANPPHRQIPLSGACDPHSSEAMASSTGLRSAVEAG